MDAMAPPKQETAILGRDGFIMRASIWAGLIRACNNLGIFSFSGHFSILILKVSILLKYQFSKLRPLKVKIDKCPEN